MSVCERASISGTALSYLLTECVTATGAQEGFLLGNVTEETTSHISDSQRENSLTEVIINVTSTVPGPDVGLFYSPSGKIKENIVRDMLADAASKVVGWYRYRRNNSLKPTMRDKVISRGLQKYFESRNCKYFVCCNLTCKQSSSAATHTFSYRFSKVDRNGDMEVLQDMTSNLGEKVTAYKRGIKGDRSDPFNRAVRNASGKGISGVANAIEKALTDTATEAYKNETAIRAVSTEINQMLQLLAEHYQSNANVLEPARSTASRLQEESEVIRPLATSLTAPATSEPFAFVNDLIKSDLKRIATVQNANSSTFNESCPSLRASSTTGSDMRSENKVSGHKRIHSEGALQPSNIKEKGRSGGSREWKPNSDFSNANNNA